jgi:hypothetical protein
MKGPKYNSWNPDREYCASWEIYISIYYFGADLIYLFEFLVDGDRRNSDRMVVGFTTAYAISASKPVHTEMYSI